MKAFVSLILVFALGPVTQLASGDDKTYNLNVRDASLSSVLRGLAKSAGYEFVNQNKIDRPVSYEFEAKSFDKIMGTISRDLGFQYTVVDGKLIVSGLAVAKNTSGITRIPVHYVKAKSLQDAIPKNLIRETDSVSVDEEYNALVYYGSASGLNKVKAFAKAFDSAPEQIYIEAQIVETSYSVSQDLGFTYGDLTGSSTLGNRFKWSGAVTPTTSADPKITLRYFIGNFSGNQLEAQLIAAESQGKVSIVSRPKIVTLNNKSAEIHSGVTYNVKTLSSTTVDDGSGGLDTVSGGLEEITAGLDLKVTPNVVEGGKIKLLVDIVNSEPDNSLAVDGIPGIVDNSANSTLIVNDGDTVSLVGLMKTNFSHTETGVPWLRRIPLLGILFGGYTESDTKSELVVFITPRIVKAEDLKRMSASAEKSEEKESDSSL